MPPAKRAICPVCKRMQRLKSDGTFRSHQVPGHFNQECSGSGQKPKTAQ